MWGYSNVVNSKTGKNVRSFVRVVHTRPCLVMETILTKDFCLDPKGPGVSCRLSSRDGTCVVTSIFLMATTATEVSKFLGNL